MEIDNTGHLSGKELPADTIINNRNPSRAAWHQSIYLGATGAWSRELINIFGAIKYKNAFEDQVLGFRAILHKRISFIDKPLVKYRSYTGISNTERSTKRQMINCIDLQKQKIADIKKSKIPAPGLLVIASLRLIICSGVNIVQRIQGIIFK